MIPSRSMSAPALLLGALLAAGCADRPPGLGAALPAPTALDRVTDGEPVLATVGGSRIGETDLAMAMARTLGDAYGQLADGNVEATMLESMIASRAIALEAFAEMDADERAAIDKRVGAFREELLVKRYLVDHAEPHTVTAEAVADYYEDHPEEFEGTLERLYEIVTVAPEAYERDAREAIALVSRAKTRDDWRALATETADEPVAVGHSYRTLVGDAPVGPIEEAVVALEAGETSRLVVSGGAPYLVRLLEVTRGDPVPLEQARADIRRKLLPRRVRDAVRTLSDAVLERTEVTRPTLAVAE